MVKLTIRRIGNSLGFTLSRQSARTLGLSEGDELLLSKEPAGFRLIRHDSTDAETMALAEGFMSRYKNALRDLAN